MDKLECFAVWALNPFVPNRCSVHLSILPPTEQSLRRFNRG